MATRLYFPASSTPDVTPPFDESWWGTEAVAEATTHKLNNVKGSSAITIGSRIGPGTTGYFDWLDRVYVSNQIAAGTVFTGASTTVKLQLMVREYNNNDNVNQILTRVKIVSQDGQTVRKLLADVLLSSVTEFINNVSHRNHSLAATTITQSYTTVAGDRLAIEIGYSATLGDASTPEASAKWGENATDLPENNTQTTDGAPWIEFSNTITFSNAAPRTPRPISIGHPFII